MQGKMRSVLCLLALLLLSGCTGQQSGEASYRHTINYAAAHPQETVTLFGEVVNGNPVKGLVTVYGLRDDTGRVCEVRTRMAVPRIGSRIEVQGRVTAEHSYAGDMTVFHAEKQSEADGSSNLLIPLLFIGGAVGIALLMMMAAMMRQGNRSRRHISRVPAVEPVDFAADPGHTQIHIPLSNASLHILSGPISTASIPLPVSDRIVFGRKPSGGFQTIKLDHAHVSETQGEFGFDEDADRWSLTAGCTTNPTYHNGRKLDPGEEVELHSGDQIRIGDLKLEFRIQAGGVHSEASDPTSFIQLYRRG